MTKYAERNDIPHDDDQLTRYDDVSYAYNDAGQLRSKTRLLQTTTFEYGELEQVEFPDGRTIEYEHDSMRRRIARKVEGTYTHRFIYGSTSTPSPRSTPTATFGAGGWVFSTGLLAGTTGAGVAASASATEVAIASLFFGGPLGTFAGSNSVKYSGAKIETDREGSVPTLRSS